MVGVNSPASLAVLQNTKRATEFGLKGFKDKRRVHSFAKQCLTLFFQVIIAENSSLSNTVEQIRPVNGLTRLVRPVQVVKQWFTGCTGRGSMVTCISLVTLHFNLNSTTRTTRTGRTGRETMVHELYNW